MGQRIRRRTNTASDDATRALLRLAEGFDDDHVPYALPIDAAPQTPRPKLAPPAAAWPTSLAQALRLRARPYGE